MASSVGGDPLDLDGGTFKSYLDQIGKLEQYKKTGEDPISDRFEVLDQIERTLMPVP